MAIPLLDCLDIEGKVITADAMLTQRALATYLVERRRAHYLFTVKGNHPTLLKDLQFFFQHRGEPDDILQDPPDHGRIEIRKIWVTTELNNYLNFPHVQQAFVIERHVIDKKRGTTSIETAYGITSQSPELADARTLLLTNRGHWTIENCCHYILDWTFDEDRCRIRTGYGPENMTRLRKFAIGLIKSKGASSVAQKMRQLAFNVRLLLDYLKMTKNSCPRSPS